MRVCDLPPAFEVGGRGDTIGVQHQWGERRDNGPAPGTEGVNFDAHRG
jgi:hypothetical protein